MKQSEIMRQELQTLEAKNREEEDRLWNSGDKQAFHKAWREHRATEEDLGYKISRQENLELEVGDGATICLWTDREACTVIKRTAKTLYVQRDKATRDPSFTPEYIPGGFSAHCINENEQKWILERDTNGTITRFNWSEKRGRWQSGADGSIGLIVGRHEYYDYNF